MSTPALHLAELPTEILEYAFLHLPGQDIIKMGAVNRQFQGLVRNSPALQHRCKLFAAGLTVNPCNPCDLAERQKLLESYLHKWSNKAVMVKGTHKLPPSRYPRWDRAIGLGRNMLASHSTPEGGLDFLCIPSIASRKPVDGWSIPPFSFEVLGFTAYPPENLLAVAEQKGCLLRLHLLNLRDGSPYCAPPPNNVTWSIPQGEVLIRCEGFAITGSRVMMYISHLDATPPDCRIWRVLVWDRKTGDLVLDLPTVDRGELTLTSSRAAFLDEFRIIVSTRRAETDITTLTVFNTLLPRDCPGSSRRLSLPPQYHDGRVLLHTDQDMSLGTLNRDGPLIPDPSQAIIVLQFLGSQSRFVLHVVQVQVLIEHVCSTRTDDCIPWDEWGRGTVTMEIPIPISVSPVYVHGTHVMVKSRAWHHLRGCVCVRTFDFGRRGRSALPLWDGEGGGAQGRRAFFKDGQEFMPEGSEDMAWWEALESLGNGSLFRLVEQGDAPDSDIVLDVWELT